MYAFSLIKKKKKYRHIFGGLFMSGGLRPWLKWPGPRAGPGLLY